MVRMLSSIDGALKHLSRLKRLFKQFHMGKVFGILTIIVLSLYTLLREPEIAFELLQFDANESKYPPFEPQILQDFPTVQTNSSRIPHIIHQTFKTEKIPSYYAQYVRSFVDLNPGWEYYFWTDESARALVAERHPYLLQLWDSYAVSINRADVLRYIVLYEYGGIYADLDFECLRPLNRLTYKYSCIFPPEPFEMTAIVNNLPYFINNAIMLCRPKHPFLKQMIDSLSAYQPMDNLIDQAGPAFVTSQFIIYNNLQLKYNYSEDYLKESNSPFFYKGRLSENHDDAVYVPNSKYFFNKLDDHHKRIWNLQNRCRRDFQKMLFNQKRACIELQKRLMNKGNMFAFTEHHWLRSYEPDRFFTNLKEASKNISIKAVVERVNLLPANEKRHV